MSKSSKYTQASSPLEVGEYPLPEELSGPQHYLNNSSSSEFLLKDETVCPRPFTPERPPSRVAREDIEMMCNCGVRNPGYQTKGRGKGHWGSEQNIVLNRSYTSLPKLDLGNQYSLDRKIGKRGRHSKHTYVCEQNRRILERLERKASLKRIRSPPEVHRGRECPRHGYLAEGDPGNTWKECKCDDYGFVGRGGSYRIPSSRGQCRGGRRRPAGDGMDAEMDAPELLFGLAPPDHILGDATCIQCPYSDHVHYAPAGYTPCLQLVGPADVKILDIDDCPGFIGSELIFDLEKNLHDKRQYVAGNVTVLFDIDDELMVSLYGYGCKFGWEYDTTWYKRTVPSQENWICEREVLVSNALSAASIGEGIGILFFGYIGDRCCCMMVQGVFLLNVWYVGGNPFLVYAFMVSAGIPGNLLGNYLCNRVGRRLNLLVMFSLLMAIAVMMIFLTTSHVEALPYLSIASGFFISASWESIVVQTVELLPDSFRSRGYSVCQLGGNLTYMSVPYVLLLDELVFPPAPDVTRRLGTITPVHKLEPPGSPPYYRSTSAAGSSSNSGSFRLELSSKHWWIIATILLVVVAAGVGVPIMVTISSSASFEERLEFATRLLQVSPLVDGHNDLPWNIRKFLHNKLKGFHFDEDLRRVSPWNKSNWSHTDLLRLEQGQVSAQFWAAYVPCDSQYKDAVQLTLEQIDVIRRLTEMYHPRLNLCTSAQEIEDIHHKHQRCSLIGVEGGHSLANSLAVLRSLYHVGVRYLTLTSTCNTPWADCSHVDMPGKKPEHGGLTSFGKTVVKEMNRLGMIVDLSHVSVGTMKDALDVSKAPVIFSHSSAHALCNSTRNVPDATLRKLALNKGVIMVNFYARFLTCKDVATLADAVAHINHIREVAGVDNVGLGAGYDGINFVPRGLEDVSSYPVLFAELIATGKWSGEDLKKLAGKNFLRVFREVERVRDEFLKAKVAPYEDTISPPPKNTNCTSLGHL